MCKIMYNSSSIVENFNEICTSREPKFGLTALFIYGPQFSVGGLSVDGYLSVGISCY